MKILNKAFFVGVLAALAGAPGFGSQEEVLFSDRNPFAVRDAPLYRAKDTANKMWKEDGWTDWFEAVVRGNEGLAEALFKYHKIDINTQGYKKQTALHIAAENGHVELAKALLQWGANVNAEDRKKETPLHVASREGQIEVVRLLLAEDAIRVNQKNYYDTTPLNVALINRNTEIAKLLLNREDINATQEMLNGWEPLHGAALCGDVEVVKLLLSKEGIDVNTRTHIGWTPLKIAAREGHVEVVKLLLGVNGIKVREERYLFYSLLSRNGEEPLDFAIKGGHRDVAEVLLEHMHKLQIAGVKNALPSESEFEERLRFVQEKAKDTSLSQEKRDGFEGIEEVLEKFKAFALPSSDESDNLNASDSSD